LGHRTDKRTLQAGHISERHWLRWKAQGKDPGADFDDRQDAAALSVDILTPFAGPLGGDQRQAREEERERKETD
jgi:hypothetical protein